MELVIGVGFARDLAPLNRDAQKLTKNEIGMRRGPREGEVKRYMSARGFFCISIFRRSDGNDNIFVDTLSYDADEEIHYRSYAALPKSGIFGTLEDAEKKRKEDFRNGKRSINTRRIFYPQY